LVHYPRGWGMASNTPFRLYKASTHAGGVRVPFVVSWPAGIPASERGAIRHQYQYVNDLLPTILEAAGVADPGERDGRSFAPSLADPGVGSTHLEQYSECFGNRSFYRDGWKLVTLHDQGTPFGDGEWELYDLTTDPTETIDLAQARPDKVRELADRWEQAAWDNAVFPLDDGFGLLVGRRPDEASFREPVTLLPGTPSLERYRSQRLVAFRSFAVEVRLEHGATDAGVLVAHGDQGGGYSLYVEDGHLRFAYNQYGDLLELDAGALPAGERLVELRAAAGPDLTWDWTVVVDGAEVGALPWTEMLVGLAPFQGIDVGIDRRSPVVWSVHERHGAFPYSGALRSVTYVPGEPAPYDPETLVQAIRAAGLAAQ
ncbi:MAG: putative arylsulfatase, partial [Actinomycetia bacterium]|nr:putative arylsulfatase [Actinomycetes bacterium]